MRASIYMSESHFSLSADFFFMCIGTVGGGANQHNFII